MQLRWESSKVDSWAVDVDEDWDHVRLSRIPVLRGFSGGWNHKDIQKSDVGRRIPGGYSPCAPNRSSGVHPSSANFT